MTVPGSPTRKFEYSELDFEDIDVSATETAGQAIGGTIISAVGLGLTLVKNIGSLEVQFEGPEEGIGKWKFQNL